MVREINSVPSESQRHALLSAVEARLRPDARKRLADVLKADVHRDAARSLQPSARGKPVVTLAPSRSIRPIASIAPVPHPSPESDATVENATQAVGQELNEIKQVYETAPRSNAPDAGQTLWN